VLVLGELSLDGTVQHVNGVLPMATLARESGIRSVFVPAGDAAEAALVEGISVYPIASLTDVTQHLQGTRLIEPMAHNLHFGDDEEVLYPVDFSDIKGQETVKRALEVACAGGHNALLKGGPGAGKTLLARALPSIMPRLTLAESLEVTRIYSVADALPKDQPLLRTRPFRAPHHTISHAGLVGGGRIPRPGEISLAHRGVLFLDELPEFSSKGLETLRQPLEDRIVTISRASGTLTFPAAFIMVAAMNPCPCGNFGDATKDCSCSMGMVFRYQSRISGPLLDRIDIHLDVPRVAYDDLINLKRGDSSAAIRARVENARAIQNARFAPLNKATMLINADMGPAEVQEFCALDSAGANLMRAAMQQMNLSARGYHRTLKLARTIADLAGSEKVEMYHLAEALQYRPKVVVGG
jgi:magnesium chelatase family protein